MKQLIVIFSASLLALPLFGQEKSTQLKDQKDKVSYSIGLQIGFNLSRQKVDISPEMLASGIKDALAGKPQLNPDQIKEVMSAFEKDMEQKQKQAGDKNKAEGTKFLEENKKKEGVKTTASGLQYKVLKDGNGAQPKTTDTVTVNYRGTLINGTEFDSSYKRGQPATFPVNGVIKGWTEALQLMKVGSKYQLFIPSDLAYGERSVSPDLASNKKAEEIVVLDLRAISTFTDFFVICSATSEPQLKAIANEIETRLREDHSIRPVAIDGFPASQWIVLDYLQVVVHVFHRDKRSFYSLEDLWGDAPRFEWEAATAR